MSYYKKLTVGLFGYGVVGKAVYEVLCQTPSLQAEVKRICIKNPEKQRNIDSSYFTVEKSVLLSDPEINVIIEATDDAEASFQIAKESLSKGIAFITANKKMVAENLEALIGLQQKFGTPLLYESACCASIPVIRNLEEYYDNDLLQGLEGVINGSTNFILTKMFDDRLSFEDALKLAQVKGFAESDPSLDTKGLDAVNKFCILLAHAYGILVSPEEILFHGIEHINLFDAQYAASRNCQIKLVASAVKLDNGKVAAFVLPKFVSNDHLLYQVKNEYNGLVITSALADQQFFYGKGAGGFPTASAILSDLSALRYDYRYEYKKLLLQKPSILSNDILLNVYCSFDNWEKLPADIFESVDEYFSSQGLHYRKGSVFLKKLLENDWWKKPGISLILCENGINHHRMENGKWKSENDKSGNVLHSQFSIKKATVS